MASSQLDKFVYLLKDGQIVEIEAAFQYLDSKRRFSFLLFHSEIGDNEGIFYSDMQIVAAQ